MSLTPSLKTCLFASCVTMGVWGINSTSFAQESEVPEAPYIQTEPAQQTPPQEQTTPQQQAAPQEQAVPQQQAAPSQQTTAPRNPEKGRVSNPVAVFSGLDKITGRITSFDVYIGETYQFGALQVTPRVCYTNKADEATRTDGFVEVNEITLDKKIQRIFTGWMFADSPGLNAVEHPIYDVWLKDCKQRSKVPAPQ